MAGVEVEAECVGTQVLAQPQESVDPAHDGSRQNLQRHAAARILDHRQKPIQFPGAAFKKKEVIVPA